MQAPNHTFQNKTNELFKSTCVAQYPSSTWACPYFLWETDVIVLRLYSQLVFHFYFTLIAPIKQEVGLWATGVSVFFFRPPFSRLQISLIVPSQCKRFPQLTSNQFNNLYFSQVLTSFHSRPQIKLNGLLCTPHSIFKLTWNQFL